jgi:hypothetical protein
MVPVPKVSSLAELNELVTEGDRLDDLRHIDTRRISVAEHFALEFPHLRALPAAPFDSGQLLRPRVDAKSRICVRQSFYSVPVRYAGTRIEARLGAETVEALDGSRVVALHARAVGKGVETLELDHYLGTLQRSPRPLLRGGPAPPGRQRGNQSTHRRLACPPRPAL